MSIDRFTPRALIAAIRALGNGEQNFLMNGVFQNGGTHPTDTLDFGVMKIPARVVAYQRTGGPAVAVDKLSGQSKTVKAPKMRLKKAFDEAFALSLNPALDSYVGPYMDPNSQMAEKVNLELAKLRMDIDRSVEIQCAQALQTGQVTITFEDGTTATIDFEFTGNGTLDGPKYTIQKTLTGTDLWTSAGSNPWKTLEKQASNIRKNSTYSGPLDVLLGYDAWAAFIDNAKVLATLSTWNLNPGVMAPVAQSMFKGTYNGFRIFQYSIGYENAAGTRVEGFDESKYVMLPRVGSGRLTIEHAAVFDRINEQADSTFIQTDFFAKTLRHGDPPVEELIVETRPLAVIKDPSELRVQKVV